MRTSSSSLPPETTEVLYGNDNIQMRVLETFSWVKEELDGCVEFTEIARTLKLMQYGMDLLNLKKV